MVLPIPVWGIPPSAVRLDLFENMLDNKPRLTSRDALWVEEEPNMKSLGFTALQMSIYSVVLGSLYEFERGLRITGIEISHTDACPVSGQRIEPVGWAPLRCW